MTARESVAPAGERRFVSRGGVKLDNAIAALKGEVAGRRCLDVGAATGGFTDCLLKGGAAEVIALDVAYGALDWGLRNDPRVHVIERTNARYLKPADLPFRPDLVTVDASFISLATLLPAVIGCMAEAGELLAMVKPQFELPRERVGRGGVVRDATARREAIRSVARTVRATGLCVAGLASSGLAGPKGNLETFVWAGWDGDEVDLEAAIREVEP